MALRNGLRVSPWLSHYRALMMVVTVPRRTPPTLVPLSAATAKVEQKTTAPRPTRRRTSRSQALEEL